jgi:uncharacterized protein YbgA (DUF1722 family)
LPGEKETRLDDPDPVERLRARRSEPGDLVAFPTVQKLAAPAHLRSHYTTLGRFVAAAGGARLAARLAEYGALLLQALSIRATRARHANVLSICGLDQVYLSPHPKEPMLRNHV